MARDTDDFTPPADGSEDGSEVSRLSRQKDQVSRHCRDSFNPVVARLTADFEGVVPAVPATKQGKGKRDKKNDEKKEEAAAGSGYANRIFAPDFRGSVPAETLGEKHYTAHPAHPAAVLLVMAWSRHKRIPREERAGLLLDLESMEPAEQVRRWHGACLQDGLKPWRVLFLPAELAGADCAQCRHLITRHEALGMERAQYRWACGQGYLILEAARGMERVWIAPHECGSFEHYRPSAGQR
jgi:hypothetical protein